MKKGLFVLVAALIILACGDGNVRIEVDPAIQSEIDSIKIAEFLSMNGYTDDEIGITTNGVRYVILDSGSMVATERIDESDQVDIDYVGKTLGDTIFDTSIKAIGDSLEAHYEANPFIIGSDTIDVFTDLTYEPLFVTYSASGWTIPTGQGAFIVGFAEGIANTFGDLGVGGKVIILIPSGLAYGATGTGVFIDPNTPIMFELTPVSITKQ